MSITTNGLVLPALLGHELVAYIDRSPAPFGRGFWSFTEGHATTFGLDAGSFRFRLVVDRLAGRRPAGWGLVLSLPGGIPAASVAGSLPCRVRPVCHLPSYHPAPVP
jgi:hypothetical protein